MMIDDFMFHVGKGWYRLYWGLMVVFNTTIVAGCTAVRLQPSLAHTGHIFNLDSINTLVLSVGTLLYLLVVYFLMDRLGMAASTLTGAMANTLVLLNGLINTTTAEGATPYIAFWFIGAVLGGLYGIIAQLGVPMVAGMYVLLQGKFNPAAITKESWILLGGSLLLTASTYPFWRKRYISRQEQQMSKLSGMLRTKQEQSIILIQSIADGVIVTDTDGKITLMNRAAANMTGWTVEEAAGVDVQLVCKLAKENGSEVSKEQYPFSAVMVHKAFMNQMFQITARDGRKQIISLVISPVVTSAGEVEGAVAVMRDVSEQRAAEKQSAEFISTASHEMRTPVAAIEGYLALALNDKVSTVDSRARGFLEKAHASTQHLGQLFQDLLTSAKAEDGRLSNHPAVVEVGSFLQQLVEDLRFAAQKKGLGVEFVVGTSGSIDATKSDEDGRKVVAPLYYIYADPDRVREVITNLFDNACKYTDSGKISIGLTGNGEVVQLFIRDTGAGIPAEDISHLFQKFYRVDNSATRTVGGTGLGLFICRKIIELYQGRIWVESELGKGSTFFINLPRLDAGKAAQLQSSTAAPSTPQAG